MKQQALNVVEQARNQNFNPEHELTHYLQQQIMRCLFETDYFEDWIYHGGVCLQDVYDNPRYSRDLDFHLDETDLDYDWDSLIDDLKNALEDRGYIIDTGSIRYADEDSAVQSVDIKFAGGLAHEAGLTPHESQKITIRVENDARPPQGWTTNRELINNDERYAVEVHDKPSILADKIAAMFERPWIKGRDYFDVLMLCSNDDTLTPNIDYLNDTINQQRVFADKPPLEEPFTENNWRDKVIEHVKSVDFDDVRDEETRDLLENSKDFDFFTRELMIDALKPTNTNTLKQSL